MKAANLDRIKLLKQKVTERLDLTTHTTDEGLIQVIEDEVFAQSDLECMTALQKQETVRRLFYAFRGLDVLQPLIDDRTITEIMVNRFDEIFIEQNGRVHQVDIQFENEEKLENIIQTIVAKVNRIVNESSPIVDARLPDGSRVNVVLPPVSLKGPTMTIRKFPEKPLTLEQLITKNALTHSSAEFLRCLVEAKYNIFISGGTGSGKTTFLNALSQWIPANERIITIEDSAELQIVTVPNLVSLETRTSNTEGKGEVTIRDLIRSSLRMRPDRIIVGEVRGSEAANMLTAMNTGHGGCLSTGHANSCLDMMSRLETMVLSGVILPVEVIRKQIVSALDIVVQLGRLRDRSRRVVEICEVMGIEQGEIRLNQLFIFKEKDVENFGLNSDLIEGELTYTGSPLYRVDKLRMAGVLTPEWLCVGEDA